MALKHIRDARAIAQDNPRQANDGALDPDLLPWADPYITSLLTQPRPPGHVPPSWPRFARQAFERTAR
jgi:hypothetical protein